MKLHTDERCCNAILLLDEADNEIGTINGPCGGEDNITPEEREIAELICDTFNDSPESADL